MPVLNPRTRLVNFRVSEEEFLRLKEGCARSGARSVSDFARSAVLGEVSLDASQLPGRPFAGLPLSGIPLLELSHRWNRLEERIETVLSSAVFADASAGLANTQSGQPSLETPHE